MLQPVLYGGTVPTEPFFNRLEILAGRNGMVRLENAGVIVFGAGGVGSWCAESLVRSGIGRVAIVDPDVVCITNVNRQLQATTCNVGAVKVDELADRFRKINPSAEIIPVRKSFKKSDADGFELDKYDYVVDAIDSLSNKVDLIIAAHSAGALVYTALGAANKLDPAQIKVASLWDSKGCPLGSFVRKRLRRKGFTGDVTCVYSEENLPLHETSSVIGTEGCSAQNAEDQCGKNKQVNGSVVHITAIFGFTIAGLIVKDILEEKRR
jgi:tRNA threonylcarbamoyladenosine dehydratase